MNIFKNLVKKFNQLILPNEYCVLCQTASLNQICTDCYNSLIDYTPTNKCWKCQIIKSPIEIYCRNCIENSFVFDRVVAAFDYKSPLDKILHQIKYNHKLNYVTLVSELFYSRISQQIQHLPDVMIPIPLHDKKLKLRGFNQVNELIRQFTLNHPQIQLLNSSRIKETQAQATLNRYSRIANMHNAFYIAQNLSGKSIAIIDDVVTTGTTVNEMARLCKKLGANKVEIWCFMRAQN